MSSVSVRTAREAEFDAWDTFVSTSPDGSPYATAKYLDILCRATGGRFVVIVAEKGAEMVGGVALYFEPELGQPVISTRLLLYYGGPVLKHYDTKYPSEATSRYLQVHQALAEAMEQQPAALIRLRPRSTVADVRVYLGRGWTATPTYSYVVDLTNRGLILGRIEQNLRRLINRAGTSDVTISRDDDVESFLRLHHQVHDRKGARLYLPDKAFRSYLRSVIDAGIGRLYHARLPDGTAAATQLVLADRHPVAHTVSAGADHQHQNTGANPFLRFKVFEQLADDGYHGCDLTDAALNPVTRFKSQLGGQLLMAVALHRPPTGMYRVLSAGQRARIRLSGFLRKSLRRSRPGAE